MENLIIWEGEEHLTPNRRLSSRLKVGRSIWELVELLVGDSKISGELKKLDQNAKSGVRQ